MVHIHIVVRMLTVCSNIPVGIVFLVCTCVCIQNTNQFVYILDIFICLSIVYIFSVWVWIVDRLSYMHTDWFAIAYKP